MGQKITFNGRKISTEILEEHGGYFCPGWECCLQILQSRDGRLFTYERYETDTKSAVQKLGRETIELPRDAERLDNAREKRSVLKHVTPAQAVEFYCEHWMNDDGPLVPLIRAAISWPKPTPEKRPAKKAAPTPFAVQLEMATGLVEVVRTLDTAPDTAKLAEARREVSKLHQSLHAETAFKRASRG